MLAAVSAIAQQPRDSSGVEAQLHRAFELLGASAQFRRIRLLECLPEDGSCVCRCDWQAGDARGQDGSEPQRLDVEADPPPAMTLPIRNGQDSWGVIEFEPLLVGHNWTAEEQAICETVAYLVGIALEGGELARARDDWERRYQTLFEETNDAIFILSPEGEHLDANQRAAEMLGYELDELLSVTFRQIVAPGEQPDSIRVRETLLAGDAVPLYERRLVRKNGEEIPVEVNATLVRDIAGNPLYIQSASRDISSRKQAEEALHERRRALHLVISSMPNLLLIVDKHDTLSAFFAPPQLRAILDTYGLQPGTSLAEIMPPGAADHVAQILARARESGEISSFEYPLRLNDDLMHFRIKVSSVTDSSDVLIVADDITERKRSEEALNRRDAILEILAYTSEQLLLDEPETAIPNLLERLGQTVDASNVFVLENEVSADGSVQPGLRYEWVSPHSSLVDAPQRHSGSTRPSISFDRWAELLRAGGPVCGTARDFPEPERLFLASLGIKSIALVPIFSEGVWWGVLGFGERARERSWLNAEMEAFKNVAAALGAALARQRIQAAEQEQRALAEALRDIGSILNGTLDLDQVLEHILTHLDRVVPHDSANIMLIDEGVARLARARGYVERGAEEALGAVYFPVNSMFDVRQLIEAGKPVAIPDTRMQSEWVLPEWASLIESQWVRSYAGAPIRLDGEMIGFLNVDSATPGFLNQAHAERLQAFADQAAVAIRNARLYHQVEGLAAFQERQRLARELHDGVSQSLSSANLIADVLPRVWEQSPERGLKALHQLHQLTQSALAEMRMLLMELRPEAILDMHTGDLLLRLVQVASSRAGIDIALSIDAASEPPPEVKFAIYRIAQEALNNVVKHARATEARVLLAVQPEQIELTVEDNGMGFEPYRIAADHFGVSIMLERAGEIGAQLDIDSHPNCGTKIYVRWLAEGGMNHNDQH